MPDQNNLNIKSRTLKLAKMALMIAVAVICSFGRFPILPSAPFLQYEVSDIPLIIAGFAFGPLAGMVIVAITIVISVFLPIPGAFVPYGPIMHFIAVGVVVFISSSLYHKMKKTEEKSATWRIPNICESQIKFLPGFSGLFSLIVSGLAMTAVMIPANLLITPHFMGVPVEVVVGMILPAILPFNLLKAAINIVVVFILYKRLSPFLHKW
jgi:riboflavin transporter FmnP